MQASHVRAGMRELFKSVDEDRTRMSWALAVTHIIKQCSHVRAGMKELFKSVDEDRTRMSWALAVPHIVK